MVFSYCDKFHGSYCEHNVCKGHVSTGEEYDVRNCKQSNVEMGHCKYRIKVLFMCGVQSPKIRTRFVVLVCSASG